MRLLAIDGSYRDGGIIDQAIDVAVQAARKSGSEVEVIALRDHPIGFCRNCRDCTQHPGEAAGECTQRDGMQQLIEKIEAADGYILASPTNCFTVTALFKRFMERLVVYAYWPWGMKAPRLRKKRASKRALVITSSAAPAFAGRLFFSSVKLLKSTARSLGAKTRVALWIGLASDAPHVPLRARDAKRIAAAVESMTA